MRRLSQRDKTDAAKTSLYNPKQFRTPSKDFGVEDRPPPPTFNQWLLVCLLCAIGGAAYYGWPRDSKEMRTHIRPVGSKEAYVNPTSRTSTPEALGPELPLNGQVKGTREISSVRDMRELRIDGRSEGQHCAVRFEDWQRGAAVLSVFVRTSQHVTVTLPAGSYRVRTACARRWGIGADAVRSIATWTAPLRLANSASSPSTLDLNDI